ncbi:MAG: hypothetical protein QOF38_4846, partial [Pseudonocardiales bacterium]|nr:hypothetical protein [Pseudonocardiales bacterium]
TFTLLLPTAESDGAAPAKGHLADATVADAAVADAAVADTVAVADAPVAPVADVRAAP